MAAGADDYRSPAVTQAQLWSLVAGATHDATTRTSVAKRSSQATTSRPEPGSG